MSDDYKPVLRAGSDPLVFFKYPGADEGGAIAKGHIMAASISHILRDGETVFMGANSLIPMAGARLAQLTHAPNLTILAGASGGVNPLVEPLAPSSGDYSYLIAEAVLEFPDVLTLLLGGHSDVFFAGGLQIDRRGAVNMVEIGPHSHPTLRGPGSAAIPWATGSKRTILYVQSHDKRIFLPKVDFVTLPGWPKAGGKNKVRKGPDLVVTPLAVMDFTSKGEMRLRSVHPGVAADEVRDHTGFDLVMPAGDVPTTPRPTPHELRLMREFDSDGLLTIVI